MDLTPEQIDAIVEKVLERSQTKMKAFLSKMVEDLDIPDVRNMATKKHVSDIIDALKIGFNDEFKKRDDAINKIAVETETKIQQLIPPKERAWWKTLLDD